MKNTDIHNPHDKLFRAAMQHPEVAREFLIAHGPPHILEHIDLNTVRLCPNSFIDDELKLSQSDVLLEAKLVDPAGHIYILIEHQTNPDPPMPLRSRQYEQGIFAHHERKLKTEPGCTVPVILTIIFYTGRKAYTAPRAIWQMCGDYTEMMRVINQEPHAVVEVKSLPEASLIKSLYSGTLEFIMRPQFREQISKELPHIAHNLNALVLEGEGPYVLQLLTYIAAVDSEKRAPQEIMQLIKSSFSSTTGEKIMDFAEMLRDEGRQEIMKQINSKLSSNTGDKIVDFADMLRDEGRQEGWQKGRQEGRQEGWQEGRLKGWEMGVYEANLKIAKRLLAEGSDPLFVARATELPLEQIQKLKSVSEILEN